MSVREITHRWHLPTVFAGVVIAFCLPFATVSCNGASTTFTGMQLVTHTVPHGGTFADEDGARAEISDRVEHKSSITATLTLLAAVAGLSLGLLGRRGTGWCAVIGLVLAFILGANTGADMFSGSDVTYRAGYWATLALFGWATLVQLARAVLPWWRDRRFVRRLAAATALGRRDEVVERDPG